MNAIPWHGVAIAVGGFALFLAGFVDLELGHQLGATADQGLMLGGIAIVTGPGVFMAGQNSQGGTGGPETPPGG